MCIRDRLEVLLSGLVRIGLRLSVVPLSRWMPGLLFDGNEAEIRTFLERSLDTVSYTHLQGHPVSMSAD